MRDKKRIKQVLKLIEEVWNFWPDQRFYQLLENYFVDCPQHGTILPTRCMFFKDDDIFEAELEKFIETEKKRRVKLNAKANKI